jgi:hypothetical protein
MVFLSCAMNRKAILCIFFFLSLQLIFLELHERIHIFTGWLVCGCYGNRDFSVWHLCADCARPSLSILATMTAPIFTLLVCFVSAWFTRSRNRFTRFLAFCIFFANVPLVRLLAVAQGGSDESDVWRYFFENRLPHILLRGGILLIVAGVLIPALVIAFRNFRSRFKLIAFAALCYLPGWTQRFMLDGLNALVHRGVLAQPIGMGSPLLTTVMLAINLAIALTCGYALMRIDRSTLNGNDRFVTL